MSTDQYIWQTAEASLGGQLTPEAARELEGRLASDPAFAQSYQECLDLLRSLNDNGRQHRFRSMLQDVHREVAAAPVKKRIRFQPQYLRTAAVAAGIALFTSLVTVWTMQHQVAPKMAAAQKFQELVKEVKQIKVQQNHQQHQIEVIKDKQEKPATAPLPSNFTGTGFALTNDGYITTSYHVIKNADSVYIQTRAGEYFKVRTVAFEPASDLAILKVEDSRFRFGKGDLPYTLTPGKAPLGARIFTLGFPQNEIVYNEGYISSRTGYEGDSLQYRLDVAADPGQSGAPVLDERGNVLALINGKDRETAGTTYAVSSKALLRFLQGVPRASQISLPKANRLSRLSREQQIEKLQDYTCMVQVYKRPEAR